MLNRTSKTLYSSRGTPGSTIRFENEEDKELLKFLVYLFECHRMGTSLNSKQREKLYRKMWGLGKRENNPSKWGRPAFVEYFQRSGNCVMKSIGILVRTVLQRSLAKRRRLGINSS
jgi:hypothetical protein